MMDSLKNYWTGLSLREKRLWAVAGVLVAVLLLWLIARPAMMVGQDLYDAQRAAVEREGRVAAKVALLKTPVAAQSIALNADAAIDQYLAQAASEMGLSLSRNERRGDHAVSIAIANGKAQVVTAWLADLERQGFSADTITLTPQADGTLGVTADLQRMRP